MRLIHSWINPLSATLLQENGLTKEENLSFVVSLTHHDVKTSEMFS